MELFGIGPMELLLVFVLALIFIGPGKMPEVAASLGKALREFRAASAELTDALNAEIAEAERRKSEVGVAENGHGHSEVDTAQAEVVAQAQIEAPEMVEYAPAETPPYQDETPEPGPVPDPTIDDVLSAIAAQEAEAVAQREAEEAARQEAIALERAIRNGVGPLPESLLLPTGDAPLAVVNPTEQASPTQVETAEDSAADEAAESEAEVSTEPSQPPVDETAGSEPEVPSQDVASEDASAEPEVAAAPPGEQSYDPPGAAEPAAAYDGQIADGGTETLEVSGSGHAEVHQ